LDVSILWCQKNLENYLQLLLDNLVTIQDTQQIDKVTQKQMSSTLQVLENFFSSEGYPALTLLFREWFQAFSSLNVQSIEQDALAVLLEWIEVFSLVLKQGVSDLGAPTMVHFLTCSEQLIQKSRTEQLDWETLVVSLKSELTWKETAIDQADEAVWQEIYRHTQTLFAEMASLEIKTLLACDLQSLMPPLLKLQPLAKKLGLPILIVSLNSIKSILDRCVSNDSLSEQWGESFAQIICALEWSIGESTQTHRNCCDWFSTYQSQLITLKKELDEQTRIEQEASEAEPLSEATSIAATEVQGVPVVEAVSVPAPQVMAEKPIDVDPELLSIFEEESQELLEMIQEAVQQWRDLPTDDAPAQSLKRDLHTLKGCARTVGVTPISHLVHSLETFIVTLYENKQIPEAPFFDSIQAGIDHIAQLLEQFKTHEVLALNQALIDSWETGSHVLPASEVSAVKTEPTLTPVIEHPTVSDEASTSEKNVATVGSATANKSAGEVIRIKAQDVDKFTQLATVANVSRSQLEKELTDMTEYVNGVIQGIEELQAQLRLMQDEVQITANQQKTAKAQNSETGFDALEKDYDTPLVRLAHTMQETAEQISHFQDSMTNSIENAENLLLDQQRVTRELQAGLDRTQLIDFKTVVPRLERIVRQVSTELKKQIRFDTTQASGDIDRRVLEHMTPALEHMLRNAMDHGIESSEKRQLANKDPIGTIRLIVSHVGGDFNLILSDDGGGINTQAIREKAIEKNMITREHTPSDQELFQMILQPGFSTAAKVSEISGRGVGMDVVHSEIMQLGGSFEITSMLGQGTTFKIRLPFTRSMNRALLFGVKQACYGIPLTNIEGIIRVPLDVFDEYRKDYHKTLEYGETSYRLRYLGELLAYDEDERDPQFLSEVPIILLKSATPVALAVDYLIGAKEIIIKSAGLQLKAINEISGATLLPDGRIILILETRAFVDKVLGLHRPVERLRTQAIEQSLNTILVVDDSLTVRKSTETLLLSHQYTVCTAKDGKEALKMMLENPPQLVLLDLEMPSMDGYEVLTAMRENPALEKIPVIMITSRDTEKHREKAFSLGADQFMGKPYDPERLIKAIEYFLHTEDA
jgi:chemosensory pili system protein ChpA (sensor histidine kinase/response regulator)